MLEIQSLSVSYNEHLVLDNITLTVEDGEILGVIGPNGAGKTTLIRAVSGVLPIRTGSISINSEDLSHLSPIQRARLLAVVPQARNLPPAFTVYQSALLGRTPYLGWLGQARHNDYTCVNKALERTQTLSMADRRVGDLSGGEQQRVLLARALAQETPVLLLDEPTTHLDLQHQSTLLNLIRELTSDKKIPPDETDSSINTKFSGEPRATLHNLSVLMVLHDLNLASLYADRVALLVEGKLKAIGNPNEVLTEKNLADVYQVPVQVMPHPVYGNPLILPDGKNSIPTYDGEIS